MVKIAFKAIYKKKLPGFSYEMRNTRGLLDYEGKANCAVVRIQHFPTRKLSSQATSYPQTYNEVSATMRNIQRRFYSRRDSIRSGMVVLIRRVEKYLDALSNMAFEEK